MLNEIMNAVTVRLKELFGDRYSIYTYTSVQGYQKPCFFVGFDEISEKPLIGNRYCRNTGISIQFFTDKDGLQLTFELNRVAETLMNGMACITVADERKLSGTQRKCIRTDDVLKFFIHYPAFGLKEMKGQEPMDQLKTEGAVK